MSDANLSEADLSAYENQRFKLNLLRKHRFAASMAVLNEMERAKRSLEQGEPGAAQQAVDYWTEVLLALEEGEWSP